MHTPAECRSFDDRVGEEWAKETGGGSGGGGGRKKGGKSSGGGGGGGGGSGTDSGSDGGGSEGVCLEGDPLAAHMHPVPLM